VAIFTIAIGSAAWPLVASSLRAAQRPKVSLPRSGAGPSARLLNAAAAAGRTLPAAALAARVRRSIGPAAVVNIDPITRRPARLRISMDS